MENFLSKEQLWTRRPKQATVTRETVEIRDGAAHRFVAVNLLLISNDNAPLLQIRTAERCFPFTVHTLGSAAGGRLQPSVIENARDK